MVIIESVLLVLLFCLGGMTAYSDIKDGKISNRCIAVFAAVGSVLDIIYYGALARDTVLLFLANFTAAAVIGLVLYYTHSIAGGDCKLIMVMSMLYPAGMYMTYGNAGVTLFIAICLAIFYGYIYLLLTSVWKLITGENKADKRYVKSYITGYLKSYATAFFYVTFINLIFEFVGKNFFAMPSWVVSILCIAIAWLSGKASFFRNRVLIITVLTADIGLSVFMKILPVSINPGTYIFTAVLILCRMTIRTNLYETIPTSRVKKGMILSTASSMAMQSSRVRGLPAVSAEDLRNRLTEEEADSVRRWGKTEKGLNEITVVRKIPFAMFIALGYVSYFVIWRVAA